MTTPLFAIQHSAFSIQHSMLAFTSPIQLSYFSWLIALALFAGAGSAQDADFLLVNGKIVTVDDAQPQVEGLAIGGSRIASLGTSAAMKRYVRSWARRRAVVPSSARRA